MQNFACVLHALCSIANWALPHDVHKIICTSDENVESDSNF